MRVATVCPRCNGTAGVAVLVKENGLALQKWIDCTLCDGVGDVPPFVAAQEKADQRRLRDAR